MEFIDYYKVLGVDKKASIKEIKAAYRKLARQYHPDVNPNDKQAQQNFQRINEANEVLSDPEKRKKYDKYGKDWKHADQFESAGQYAGQSTGGPSGFNSGRSRSSGFEGADFEFSDFFESMFGDAQTGHRQYHAQFRGQDYSAELQLQLIDVIETHKQTLAVNGKNIRITVPAGIENGQKIKIKGHGGPGVNGGPNGDLYITFTIAPLPAFKRLGADLYKEVELDLYTALLGGQITVETLTGKVKLKVKPETKNGEKVKLKEKGIPVYKKRGQIGDLYLTYRVKLPTNLSEKEKELFTELRNLR